MQIYQCKKCPKRFTHNPATGVCTEAAKPAVEATETKKDSQGIAIEILRRIFKALIIIGGLFGLALTMAQSGNATPAPSAPIVTAHIAHSAPAKPVKHRVKSRKKCQCDCKKAIDKPEETVKDVYIENVEERLTNEQASV